MNLPIFCDLRHFQKESQNKMIRLDDPSCFGHHRSGWNFCKNIIKEFTSDSGILCLNYVDGFFGSGNESTEPWIGFIHNTPFHPEHYRDIFTVNESKNGATNPLSKLVGLPNFRKSIRYCRGIFTLCRYTATYLINHTGLDVDVIYHPTEQSEMKFDFNKFKKNSEIYTIGHWLRNFQSTYDLISPYQKYIIDVSGNLEKISIERNDTVKIKTYLENKEYDELLSRVVVFLDLYDVAACNTIIECIERNTPIITRRLPASEEYLGKNYPLFFDSMFEAASLLNENKILEGHNYLRQLEKIHISGKKFREGFLSSKTIRRFKNMM